MTPRLGLDEGDAATRAVPGRQAPADTWPIVERGPSRGCGALGHGWW